MVTQIHSRSTRLVSVILQHLTFTISSVKHAEPFFKNNRSRSVVLEKLLKSRNESLPSGSIIRASEWIAPGFGGNYCFFVSVTNHPATTLIPIITHWILPDTTILSACWKSRSRRHIHHTVNHSLQFVSETGTHTNHTQSRWNALKKSLPRYGTTKALYNSYFAEYCMQKEICRHTEYDKFIEGVISLIILVHNCQHKRENEIYTDN